MPQLLFRHYNLDFSLLETLLERQLTIHPGYTILLLLLSP